MTNNVTKIEDNTERERVLGLLKGDVTSNAPSGGTDLVPTDPANAPPPLDPLVSSTKPAPKTFGERAFGNDPNMKKVDDQETLDRVRSIADADPSAMARFWNSARMSSGLVESGANVLVNKLASSGSENASYLNYIFDAVNQGTFNPDPSLVENETADSARKLSNDRQATAVGVNEAIQARPDLQEQGGAELAGMLAGAVADPTSVLPLAPFTKLAGTGKAAYASAMLTGAGLTGSDVALYQLAREGKIDKGDVAKGALLGAVLGPAMVFVGRSINNLIAAKVASGDPITPDDLDELLRLTGPEAVPLLPAPQGKLPPPPGPEGVTPNAPARLSPASGAEVDVAASTRIDPKDLAVGNRNIQNGGGGGGIGPARTPHEPVALQDLSRVIEGEFTVIEETVDNLRGTMMEAFGSGNTKVAADLLNEVILKVSRNATPPQLTSDVQSLANAITKDEATALKNMYGLTNEPTLSPTGPVNTGLPADPALLTGATQKVTRTMEDDVTELLSTPSGRNFRDQGGFASTQLMSTLGGAGMGYALSGGELEGALLGAAIGGALPYGVGRLKQIGKVTDASSAAAQAALGWTVRTPTRVISKFGPAGKRLVEFMEAAQVRGERATAEALHKMNSISRQARAKGVKKEAVRRMETEAMQILQKTLDPAKARFGASRKIATLWKKQLDKALLDAHKAGILDAKQVLALKSKVIKEGYFPRVYDEALLSSKAGEDLWVKSLTGPKGMPEKVIRELAESILGTKKDYLDFMSGARIRGRLAFLSEEQALELLKKRRSTQELGRSTHLENRRKLSVESEKILEPFLVKDPKAALTRYFEDVEKRIAYANAFGAKDERALAMLTDINKKYGDGPTKFAAEIYWQRVGDAQSSQIRAAAEMSDFARNIQGQVNAFETLKLGLAQMLNMGQATANGNIMISRMSGNPVKTFGIMGSIARDIKRNPRKFMEIADRSGAALETTLMQIMGEWSSVNHRVFGREFTGMLTPLELLNNPTKFLEMTGFVGAEKIQRALAANMGYTYAEQLVEDAAKYAAKGKKIPARLTAQAEELGINLNGTNTEKEFLDAALRFSDLVNFRNSPGNMPLAWNDPRAQWFKKFKTFAFNHARFMVDNVIKPFVKGDIRGGLSGATGWATVAMAVGIPIDTLRRVVSGDDNDYTNTEKLLRGFYSIGGMGIFWDIVRSRDPLGAVLGPAVGDAVKLHREVKQLAGGNQDLSKTVGDIMKGTLVLPREKELLEFLGLD